MLLIPTYLQGSIPFYKMKVLDGAGDFFQRILGRCCIVIYLVDGCLREARLGTSFRSLYDNFVHHYDVLGYVTMKNRKSRLKNSPTYAQIYVECSISKFAPHINIYFEINLF